MVAAMAMKVVAMKVKCTARRIRVALPNKG
jgi:hypothetical protein